MDGRRCRRFGDKISLDEKLKDLKEEMLRLKSIEEDIRTKVRNEELQARKNQRSKVSAWLENVGRKEEKLQSIDSNIEKGGHSGEREKLERRVETVENSEKESECPRLLLDYLNPEGSTPSAVQGEVWGCFLFCALYPENEMIEREELISRFIAEGFLNGSTRQEKIDKAHNLLNALENVSLLESVTNKDKRRCVKMDGLMRDMAIKIIGGK